MRFVYPILFIAFSFYFMTIPPPTHNICVISLTRGKEFRKYWQKVFYSEEDKATDKSRREKLLIDGFNEACKNISASYLKVGDESMGAIIFLTTEKGKLPHLSYINARQSQWGQSSIHSPFMLQGTCYSLKYK